MTVRDHPTSLFGAQPKNLGLALATLRYDALAVVLRTLSAQLKLDSDADMARNRNIVAARLYDAHVHADVVAADVQRAWEICKQQEGK